MTETRIKPHIFKLSNGTFRVKFFRNGELTTKCFPRLEDAIEFYDFLDSTIVKRSSSQPQEIRDTLVQEFSLYRGTYVLAVYDESDFLIGVYDNVYQMAQKTEIDYENLKTMISRIYRRRKRKIRVFNQMCSLFFIDLNNEEN